MAITHIDTAASSNTTAGTTLSVTMPSFAADDVVVVVMAMTNSGDPATTIPTAPTGWTRIDGDGVNISAISAVRLQCFYRVMEGGDGGSVDFTSSGSTGFKAIASCYRGVNTSTPINASATDLGDGTWDPVCPSVTTTVLGTKLLRIAATDSNVTLTNSAVTIRNNTGGIALPGNGCNSALGDEDQYTKRATARSVYTQGSAVAWGTFTIALAPETTYELGGVTRDVNGSVLTSCECQLFKYDSGADTITYLDHVTSDGSTGVYLFTGIPDNDTAFLVVANKAGSPNRFDVTDHDLQPEASQSTDYDLYLRSDTDKSETSPDADLRLRSDADKSASGATVTPDPVAMAFGIPTPMVMAGLIVSPDPVAVAGGVPNPTVVTGAYTLSPDPVASVGVVPNPTVAAGGTVTLSPDPVAASTGVPNLAIASGQAVVTPDPVTGALSAPATVVSKQVTPEPAVATAGVPSAATQAGAVTLTPDPATSGGSAPNPTIVKGAVVVAPTPVSAAFGLPNPTIAGADVTLTPDPVEGRLTAPLLVIPGTSPRMLIVNLTSQIFD